LEKKNKKLYKLPNFLKRYSGKSFLREIIGLKDNESAKIHRNVVSANAAYGGIPQLSEVEILRVWKGNYCTVAVIPKGL